MVFTVYLCYRGQKLPDMERQLDLKHTVRETLLTCFPLPKHISNGQKCKSLELHPGVSQCYIC